MVEEQVVPLKSNMQRLHELKVPYLSVFVNVWSKDTTALVKNSRRRSFKAQKTLQNLEFRKNWSFEQGEVDLQKLEADSVPKQTKKKDLLGFEKFAQCLKKRNINCDIHTVSSAKLTGIQRRCSRCLPRNFAMSEIEMSSPFNRSNPPLY